VIEWARNTHTTNIATGCKPSVSVMVALVLTYESSRCFILGDVFQASMCFSDYSRTRWAMKCESTALVNGNRPLTLEKPANWCVIIAAVEWQLCCSRDILGKLEIWIHTTSCRAHYSFQTLFLYICCTYRLTTRRSWFDFLISGAAALWLLSRKADVSKCMLCKIFDLRGVLNIILWRYCAVISLK
jgi:hypothetical protein